MPSRGRGFWSFAALAIALAAVFVRLGVWQLDRLSERRTENRQRTARLAEPLVLEWRDVPADRMFWRRVELTGVYDYDREVVLFGRARNGVPGVHVATPLLGEDSVAVLVIRGWLPAADGVEAELLAGRPAGGRVEWARAVTVEGVALPFPGVESAGVIETTVDGEERLVLRSLDREAIATRTPYALLDWYVLAAAPEPGSGAGTGDEPMRPVPLPELGSGPHLSYAIQWFAFAAIAIVGTLIFMRRRRGLVESARPS